MKTLKEYIEEGKSIREISRITGIDRQTIKYRLNKIGIKSSYKHGERPKDFKSEWFKGYTKTSTGYEIIKLRKHPFADKQGYVRKHRLMIEASIGRYLKPEEVVHHIDGNKSNNELKNLMLFPNDSEHHKFHREADLK